MQQQILILGGQGFIGSYLTHALIAAGYSVVIGARNTAKTQQRFPDIKVIYCDFSKPQSLTHWCDQLSTFDIVINCIGILHHHSRKVMHAIHFDNAQVLFKACQQQNKNLIHFSALGADIEVNSDYATSKAQAEALLEKMDFNWICLRPSLVVAPTSYGGTSLLRGFAALPLIPLVGDGGQRFQPVAMSDIIKVVTSIIETSKYHQQILELAGPEKLTMREILSKLRQWLGFGRARFIKVPLGLCRLLCKLGDYINCDPFNSTALVMLNHENVTERNDMHDSFHLEPQSLSQALWQTPSSVQDRWHAKLYFMRLIARLSLGVFWMVSGLVLYHPQTYSDSMSILAKAGFTVGLQQLLFYATTTWDVLLGLGCFFSKRLSMMMALQVLTVIVYTLFASILTPTLWLDPVGALVKNIPVLFCIAFVWLIARER